MMNIRRALLVTAVVGCAVVAEAQTAHRTDDPMQKPDLSGRRIDRFEVVLNGMSCGGAPDDIYIVLDDDDGSENKAQREGNIWVWTPPKALILGDRAHASIRFGGSRTDCRNASWSRYAKDPSQYVATFTFQGCSEEPARNVTVRANPLIHVSYVRTLPAAPRGTGADRSPAPCLEQSSFVAEPKRAHTIHAVWFEAETLRLQMNRDKATLNEPGLRVNDIVNEIEANKVEGKVFDAAGVAYLFSVQRGKGRDGSPNLSSSAIDIDIKKMKDAGFEFLALSVK